MEVQDLLNYGKSGCELSSSFSKELEKRTSKAARKIVSKHLGFLGMVRLIFHSVKERRRMLKQDLSSLREKGMTNERFITREIDRLAIISALRKIVGTEKALQIGKEILEVMAPQVFAYVLPSREDFMKFDDPFDAFRQYILALAEADEKTGFRLGRIAENTNDAIQTDVTYCAFYEIAKQLGMEEACLNHCYAHDIGFQGSYEGSGIAFNMTSTLVEGASRCDLRYERARDE
jgi:hypothetical protein